MDQPPAIRADACPGCRGFIQSWWGWTSAWLVKRGRHEPAPRTLTRDSLVVLPTRSSASEERRARQRAANEARRRAFRAEEAERARQAIREYESAQGVTDLLVKACRERKEHDQRYGRKHHVSPYAACATETVERAQHTGWGIDRRHVQPYRGAYVGGGSSDACWLMGARAQRPWWRYSKGTAWEMGPDSSEQVDTNNIGRNAGKHVKSRNAKYRPYAPPPPLTQAQRDTLMAWDEY
jgi:hypothetical protein